MIKRTRTSFKECQAYCESRGWTIQKIDGELVKHGYYKTGYVVSDGTSKVRWASLAGFHLNCVENHRYIDGFLSRNL